MSDLFTLRKGNALARVIENIVEMVDVYGEEPQVPSHEQVEEIAAVLRTIPPAVTGRLVLFDTFSGTQYCALGALGAACGFSPEKINTQGWPSIRKKVEETFGLKSTWAFLLHIPNDLIIATPEDRADVIIACLHEVRDLVDFYEEMVEASHG